MGNNSNDFDSHSNIGFQPPPPPINQLPLGQQKQNQQPQQNQKPQQNQHQQYRQPQQNVNDNSQYAGSRPQDNNTAAYRTVNTPPAYTNGKQAEKKGSTAAAVVFWVLWLSASGYYMLLLLKMAPYKASLGISAALLLFMVLMRKKMYRSVAAFVLLWIFIPFLLLLVFGISMAVSKGILTVDLNSFIGQ